MVLLRYLDIVLVFAALPFVAFAGLPLLGYAVGAAAWILQRAAGVALERQAAKSKDMRRQVLMNFGGTMARAWIVGGAIIAVGLAGKREDGLTAAVLVFVAFTVYFAMTLALHAVARGLKK
jgi:hypothetical protein